MMHKIIVLAKKSISLKNEAFFIFLIEVVVCNYYIYQNLTSTTNSQLEYIYY